MKAIRIFSALLAVLMLTCIFGGCAKSNDPKTKVFYEYFDTVCTVASYADEDNASFEENCALIEKELREYHRLFDIYYEYSDTPNLKTVNDNAGKDKVKVDKKIIDLLLYAKEMYTLTGGEMNVAMGSVLSLWHDCRESAQKDPKKAAVPSWDSLDEAAMHTSIESIVIDKEESTVYISDPKVRIDVGALGKGYATEKIAKMLKEKGVTSYVLNFGGNIKALGTKPNGDGWLTGITDPDKTSEKDFARRVDLKNTSCVTSGDYERYFTVGEAKYHHIIDKDTAYPAQFFSSVTVITENSALADALSTALFCMPYEEGAALVKSQKGVEVLWIFENGEQRATDGFKKITVK